MTRFDTDPYFVWANALSRTAPPGKPEPCFTVSALRASVDFRNGPAVEWLERAGPIARRLNEESKGDDNGPR